MKKLDVIIFFYFKLEIWVGFINSNDIFFYIIFLFGGIGLDGDKDGFVNVNSDCDFLYIVVIILRK